MNLFDRLQEVSCLENLIDEEWKKAYRIKDTHLYLVVSIQNGIPSNGLIYKRRSLGPTGSFNQDFYFFQWYKRPPNKKYCLKEITFEEVLDSLKGDDAGDLFFYLDLFTQQKVIC